MLFSLKDIKITLNDSLSIMIPHNSFDPKFIRQLPAWIKVKNLSSWINSCPNILKK